MDNASTSPFSIFPVELVEQILQYADVLNIIRCRLVHRRLKNIVAQSICIQYRIELFAAGLLDGTIHTDNTSARYQKLKLHQTAWKAFHWTKQTKIALGASRSLTLAGGILVSAFHQDIRFLRLPSVLRGIALEDWTISLPFRCDSFAVDYGEDLIVAVKHTWNNVEASFAIHFLTMSEGTQHPQSIPTMNYVIETLVAQFFWRSQVAVRGAYVALLFSNRKTDRLIIWNWKTGDVLLTLLGRITSFFFLNDNYILVGLIQKKTENVRQSVLQVYEFGPAVGTKDADDIVPHVTFGLPAVSATSYQPMEIIIHSTPANGRESRNPEKEVPFSMNPDERVLAIIPNVVGTGISESSESCIIIARSSTFLGHTAGRYISWGDWAESTRLLFPSPNRNGSRQDGLVCGTRLCAAVKGSDRTLLVFDFNQYNTRRWAGSVSGRKEGRRKKTVLESSDDGPRWVDKNDRLPTSLVYHTVRFPLPKELDSDYYNVMLSEDNIILAERDQDGLWLHLMSF